MGEVYRARDTSLGRQVAIKVLPRHLQTDAAARERLRREAVAAAGLDHPFICKVFEIGEHEGALFLVMEFITGQTLFQRLRSGRPPLDEALRLAGEVAEALDHAHANHFVHRDLKPENVMLAQGHVKVMDFGLAKPITAPQGWESEETVESGPALTGKGILVGTPHYMSPEQIRGEPLDHRSDLFSFGVLLCELLGGGHPFRRETATETMAAILRDPPNLSGDLPQGLMLLIRRLLAKPREERYSSMAEARADLARLASGSVAALETALEKPIPLIGREQEFAVLSRALDDALAGRGTLVMVGGEPGIGKTHLTGAVLEAARRRGAFAVIGHCYEMEGAAPYVPFVEMLEYSARLAPRDTLRSVLGDDAPEVAKLMPELRHVFPDMPAAIQLPAEQQRRFLFNAYRSFVERSARLTPIVAVFEDLHWADESTLLLLQHLAQTLATTPMLLIGTYRDVELDVTRPFARTLETLLRQKQASRLPLRRLAVQDVESMLAALSGQPLPPSLANLVFDETDGNPFFVEEVFRHLAEEGHLFDERGTFRANLRVDRLHVPEGVRLVLGRRLDRLGDDARRVLTAGAVIGRSFSLRLLEELEGTQADAALDALEEAERAHLVTAEAAARDTRYRFVHELVRQTLADELSLPRRQRLHARIAEAAERVYASNLDAQALLLAHHLYYAGAAADPEKTTTYLLKAAHSARAGAAHEEALAHLERALSLWEGDADLRVAEVIELKAAALLSVGRTDEAVSTCQHAIALFERAGASAKAARASLSLAVMQTWRLDLEGVQRTLERALGQVGPQDPQLRCELLAHQALSLGNGGDVVTAARRFAEVDDIRKSAGLPYDAFIEASRAISYAYSARFQKSAELAQRVAADRRAAGDPWAAARIEYCVPYLLQAGKCAEVSRILPDILERARKIGHYGAIAVASGFMVALNMVRGELEVARQGALDAWNEGKAHGFAWRFATGGLLGKLCFLNGDFAEAERWLAEDADFERRSFLFGINASMPFAMFAELGDRRAPDAWSGRDWKLPVAGQLNTVGAWTALQASINGLAWLGRSEEVAALRPLAEELVATGAWATWFLFLPVRTTAGIAATCADDWAAAEQHHQIAIQQTDTAPYRVSQPMAREWYTAMLVDRNGPGDAVKARDLLGEALSMYEAMNMAFQARRVSAKRATT